MIRRLRQRFWLLVLDVIARVPGGFGSSAYGWVLTRASNATDWGDGAGLASRPRERAMVDGASKDLQHLLGKLGDPLPVQAGSNPNGVYVLVESKRDGRFVRVLVEASCGPAQVAEAVTACLAVLSRGRG